MEAVALKDGVCEECEVGGSSWWGSTGERQTVGGYGVKR